KCFPHHAIYWISIANEHWNLCRYTRDASFLTGYALCGVSLGTTTAIAVDRLLALLLGLRYKQTVTLKLTSIILAAVSVLSSVAALCYILDYRITLWFAYICVPSYLVISIFSYTKIFRTLIHYQAQVQVHVQLQSSQPNLLNISRYRKVVYSAMWVQLALFVCYVPYTIVDIVIVEASRKTFSSHLIVIRGIAATLLYSNSTLNPFLYCWKISAPSSMVMSITSYTKIFHTLHRHNTHLDLVQQQPSRPYSRNISQYRKVMDITVCLYLSPNNRARSLSTVMAVIVPKDIPHNAKLIKIAASIRGWVTRPTKRSVVARQRYKSLDGGWREDSLRRATRIREFPRIVPTNTGIFVDTQGTPPT
ncbi:hypothetical protein pdam_00017420, partial [Pocillopora damicornis]